MHTFKTRVIKTGAFWQVELYHYCKWIRHRDLHSTRAKARIAAKLLSIN